MTGQPTPTHTNTAAPPSVLPAAQLIEPFLIADSIPQRVARNAARTALAIFGIVVVAFALTAALVTVRQTVRASGTLESLSSWPVRVRQGGIITEIRVSPGDLVQNGEIVANIDSLELLEQRTRLNAVRAEAETAGEVAALTSLIDQNERMRRLTVARARKLQARSLLLERMVTHGFGTAVDSLLSSPRVREHVEMDRARAAVTEANAEFERAMQDSLQLTLSLINGRRAAISSTAAKRELELLALRMDRLVIRAPVKGVISTPRLRLQLGRHVQEGDIIMEIVDGSAWRALLRLNEKDVARVRVGDSVKLTLPAIRASRDTPVNAKVSAIVVPSFSDDATQRAESTYEVEVSFDTNTIPPDQLAMFTRGFSVDVRIIVRSISLGRAIWEVVFDIQR